MYYHSQIPGLSEEFGDQIDYLVRGMVENFEEENPYLVSFIFNLTLKARPIICSRLQFKILLLFQK